VGVAGLPGDGLAGVRATQGDLLADCPAPNDPLRIYVT